jgi:hypothetical protein
MYKNMSEEVGTGSTQSYISFSSIFRSSSVERIFKVQELRYRFRKRSDNAVTTKLHVGGHYPSCNLINPVRIASQNEGWGRRYRSCEQYPMVRSPGVMVNSIHTFFLFQPSLFPHKNSFTVHVLMA